MTYDFSRLDALITSEDIQDHAKEIMSEYQDAIEYLMGSNLKEDIQDLSKDIDPASIKDLTEFANTLTEQRMRKYGSEFFTEELERVMDAFNNNEYDPLEFKLRCEVLTCVITSLQNFKFEDLM